MRVSVSVSMYAPVGGGGGGGRASPVPYVYLDQITILVVYCVIFANRRFLGERGSVYEAQCVSVCG